MNLLTAILYVMSGALIAATLIEDDFANKIVFGVLAFAALFFGTLFWISQARGWSRDDW